MFSEEMQARLARRVGETIKDKYRLDALLGVGGMAAVYAATHRNGHRVALKFLHVELSRDMAIRERFLREGKVANKIKHAGVVRVIDDEVDADGTAYLVMELLEGDTLEAARMRAGGRLPIGWTADVTGRILDALGAAHAAGIIHRDVKPENVFLTSDGVVKLMDFGIARVRDSASATRTGALMGTPAFMPPEQASGRNKDIDARTDVWSVGALLFVMLSGEDVHPARSAQAQLMFAATRPARSIVTVCPDLSEELVHVVDSALAFDMGDRWPSAAAMGTALGAAAAAASTRTATATATVDEHAAAVGSAVTISAPGPGGGMPTSGAAPTLIHGSGPLPSPSLRRRREGDH